ncbi:hypothetical protein P7C73_g741, partial [Tremellales sp. Uapishka_1]
MSTSSPFIPTTTRMPSQTSLASVLSISPSKRQWQPSEATPLTGMIENKSTEGVVLGIERSGRGVAERGLSELYVRDERAIDDNDRPHKKSKTTRGWGGSIIHGAMSATVFSAALGLTAYRLWTTRNEPSESDSASTSTSTAGPSIPNPQRSTAGPNHGRDPPPTYQAAVEDSWEEMEDEIMTPSTSTHSTILHKPALPSKHKPRSAVSPRKARPTTPVPAPASDSDSESLVSRLDTMASRVQELIEEGQRALNAPLPNLSPSKHTKSRSEVQRPKSRNLVHHKSASLGKVKARDLGRSKSMAFKE